MINYYLITKPGIVLGNLITVAAGFLLASKGSFSLILFFATLLGLGLVMASACVFNNYIDRPLDKKMERTKNRALVTGLISSKNALFFATLLGIVGFICLYIFTNPLTTFVAFFGFFVYVILYSLWKSKTVYGTAIGSIAGAVPPLVGYVSVSNRLDSGALVLFFMLILWQMPHFFAIALYRIEDYIKANIPVLPIVKGTYRTKIQMVFYIVLFIATSTLLTFLNHTGHLYLGVTTGAGLIWLFVCLKGFKSDNEKLFGKSMFRYSLLVINAICIMIALDTSF